MELPAGRCPRRSSTAPGAARGPKPCTTRWQHTQHNPMLRAEVQGNLCMVAVVLAAVASAAFGGTLGDGALDPTFGTNGVAYLGQPLSPSSMGASVAVQSDGRIVVCDS